MRKLYVALLLLCLPVYAAVPDIASNATITLRGTGIYRITGTNTISTINGLRDGDEVLLLPAAAFGLNSAGNIAPLTTTATAGRPIHLIRANAVVYEVGPSVAGGGGGGAPTTVDYLVRTADAGLSAERVVTDTTEVVWDFATAGQAKANVGAIDAADTTTGIFNVARLGSGVTGATYYLRGDGAWAPDSTFAANNYSYVTMGAAAGLLNEVVVPVCGGTDKLTSSGVAITCAADVSGSGAPTTATYITQTADATLSAEQALSALGTGLVKNTTGTGVLSIAVANTDFVSPSIANVGGVQTYMQTVDVTTALAALTACTGLTFTFVAGATYLIDMALMATSAAATTGYGYAFDTSVAVTAVGLQFSHALATTGTVTGGDSKADNTVNSLSSGVPSTTVNFITGNGLLVAGGTGGTATLMFRPEVAASATAKANSVIRVVRIQ